MHLKSFLITILVQPCSKFFVNFKKSSNDIIDVFLQIRYIYHFLYYFYCISCVSCVSCFLSYLLVVLVVFKNSYGFLWGLHEAGGAADDEAGLDDAFLGVVAVQRAFDQADEDVGGLLAHL